MAKPFYTEFSDVLPFGSLIDDGLMLTNDGQLYRTIRVTPKDFGFRPHQELVLFNRNLRLATRYFGDGWTVHVDFDKYRTNNIPSFIAPNAPDAARAFALAHRRALGEVTVCDFYITLCYTLPDEKSPMGFLFGSPDKSKAQDAKDPSTKLQTLLEKSLHQFEEAFNDIYAIFSRSYQETSILTSKELLTWMHSLYSDKQPVRVPETPAYLNLMMADRTFTIDTVSKLDDEFVLAASIMDYPIETRASMFVELSLLPHDFRVSTRFKFHSREAAKKVVSDYRDDHHTKKSGAREIIAQQVMKEGTGLTDPEAEAMIRDATDAMEAFQDGTINYGQVTTAVIVRNKSYKTATEILDSIREVIKKAEFVVKKEDLNTAEVFLGSLPGNGHFNPRFNTVSTYNLVHCLPQSQPWEGVRINRHLADKFGQTAPHMIGKSGGRLFWYNRNVGEVGHGLVIGPSGAGKSIHLTTESLSWLAHYEKGRCITFDVDLSSKQACQNVGGQFYDLGNDKEDAVLLNPFYQLETEADIYRVARLFANYFKAVGVNITIDEIDQIQECLRQLNTSPLEHRTFALFGNYLLSRNKLFRNLLNPFMSGDYASLFGTNADDFTDSRWLVFEMRKLLDKGPDITRFCLSYIFSKIRKLFETNDVDPKYHYLLNIDEGWKLLADAPGFADEFIDWLRTLRKKHVYVTLATQNIGELHAADFEPIATQCMHRVFLPNPQALEFVDLYKSLGLSVDDVTALQEDMTPQEHYLFAAPNKGKQIYSLCIDQAQLDIIKKPFRRAL